MIEINETFFIQLVNFLIMVFFLNHFLFKPVLEMVERRNKKMRSLSSDAAKSENNAQKAIDEYDAKMGKMRKETSRILMEARQQAVAEQEKILSSARKGFKSQMEEAIAKIQSESKEASGVLQAEAESISRQMVARLLGRSMQ